MTEVILREVPLSDDAVSQLVRRLELPHLTNFGVWSSPPKRLVDRYIPAFGPLYRWHKSADHWLQVTHAGDSIRHCEIIGLRSEREARLLRQRARRAADALGRKAEVGVLRALLDEVVAQREARLRAETFEGVLRKVRHFFNPDGSLSDGGYMIPLRGSDLSDADQEVLRQVFLRLPEPIFDERRQDWSDVRLRAAPCPTCGESPHRRPEKQPRPTGERRAAQRAIGRDGFGEWFKKRLTDFDAPGVWTRATTLYADYAASTQNYDEDRTRADHAEAAAAIMSATAWGRVMVRVVQRRRDGTGNLYNVRLKRR